MKNADEQVLENNKDIAEQINKHFINIVLYLARQIKQTRNVKFKKKGNRKISILETNRQTRYITSGKINLK